MMIKLFLTSRHCIRLKVKYFQKVTVYLHRLGKSYIQKHRLKICKQINYAVKRNLGYQPKNRTVVTLISRDGMNECVSHSVMSDSVNLWTIAHQNSVEFSRKEYWSGLPFPSPGNLPDPWIKPTSHAFQAVSYIAGDESTN